MTKMQVKIIKIEAKYNFYFSSKNIKVRLETLEIKRDWPIAAIFAPLHFEENMNY